MRPSHKKKEKALSWCDVGNEKNFQGSGFLMNYVMIIVTSVSQSDFEY